MSSPATRKRQRATDGSRASTAVQGSLTPQQIESLKQKIIAIPAAALQSIVLAHATSTIGEVQPLSESINQAHAQMLEAERNRVCNFDHHSKEAWYLLNKKYSRMSGSREYEMTFEVSSDIGEMFDHISEQVTVDSSWGTKRSAVETMRKIFKSTLLTGGQMGKEVMNQAYGWDDKFMETLELFTPEELQRLHDWDDGRGLWITKLQEVGDLAESYCVFGRLEEGVDLLVKNKNGEGDDGDEDDEESAEEEDEEDVEEE